MTDAQPAYRDHGPPPPLPPHAPAPASSDPAVSAPLVAPASAPTAAAAHGGVTAPPSVPTEGVAAPPYAAPYLPARHPQYAAAVTYAAPPAQTLGVVALVLAIAALVLPALVAGAAGYGIGLGAGSQLAAGPMDTTWDWSLLSPVRDLVLLGEIAFWTGTILGTWGLVQGIVAIVSRRGRRAGIAAVVVAVLASAAFTVVTWLALVGGVASGASTLVA